MSTMPHRGEASPLETTEDGREVSSGAPVEDEAAAEAAPIDGWVPEDREPSAAENNFMSFALFGFLILFGLGCLIVF